VDPLATNGDVWFCAGRLVEGRGAASHPRIRDEKALGAARSLSGRAAELSRGEPRNEVEIASLRVLAAEWKRSAGAPEEAFADYEALARHYRSVGNLRAAMAYMRKAHHVSRTAADPRIQIQGRMIAIDVYRDVGRLGSMVRHAREVARIAGKAGLEREKSLADGLLRDLPATDREESDLCGCRTGKRYRRCCGAADVEPVEFGAKARRFPANITAGPFRNGGLSGLESLMRPPDGGEALTWYAWQVKDGCHRLMANPNWSGRALATAKRMARLARAEDCPYSASSAVLQAFVAVEAFLTSWRSLSDFEGSLAPVVQDDVSDEDVGPQVPIETGADARTDDGEDADKRVRIETGADARAGSGKVGKAFFQSWSAFASERLGSAWRPADEEGARRLASLRNALCHHASHVQEVIPRGRDKDGLIAYFRGLGLETRAAPSPWIDRIMTPDVADWAVRIASGEIEAVRKAWKADERSAEWLERWEDQDEDEAHAEAAERAAGWFDRTPLHSAGDSPCREPAATWFAVADPAASKGMPGADIVRDGGR